MFNSRKQVEVFEFGPFRLDLTVRRLYRQDNPVPLPAKTFDILKILVEHLGQIVTKEELLSQVWMNQFVEENNLAVRIASLRKALGESIKNRYIETVSGCGYRFVARVREILNHRSESDEVLNSLAVFPLINEKNHQKLNYLCDGITESLINSLSQLPDLKVMSRSTVFRYKGRNMDPLAAGQELGVGAVLIGNLNQISGSILLNIEAVNVNDGSQLWGAVYKHQASDLLALQEEVTREVSDSLRIKLSKAEEGRIAKRHTNNHKAYHLYLKGRYIGNKRSVLGVKRSIDYFRKAIKHDPRYALAHAGLADAYIMISAYGLASPLEIMPKARLAALTALEMDDQLAEAYVSLGRIRSTFEWDWAGGESAFRRAIDLNPNNGAAHHFYSMLLAKRGELEQAHTEILKAFEMDPLSVHIHLAMARILYFAKQYNAAIEHCNEMLEVDSKFGMAHGLIGMVYLEQKNYEGAIMELKKMLLFSGVDYPVSRKNGGPSQRDVPLRESDPEAIGVLGYAYGEAGERKEALKMLNRLKNLRKQRYVEPYTLALVYIGLKDNDKAFEELERSYTDRNNILTYIKVWPLFMRLQNDSRYDDLVKRIGL